ncbi:MAG: dockerin type I domain-containing protein [Halobacteriaceae archaeon]
MLNSFDRMRAVILSILVIGVVFTTISVTSEPVASASVITVDDSGGADYMSIQAAITNATDGDVIEVQPGTYEEQLVITKNITLRAPQGARLNGSNFSDFTSVAIKIGRNAAPEISGFTVVDYGAAINASQTNRAWAVVDLTIKNNFVGIAATNSTGSWQVVETTVSNSFISLNAAMSTGNWVIKNSTFNSSIIGVATPQASGKWLVKNTHINHSIVAVFAENTSGDWVLQNTTITNTQGVGVFVPNASGNWTISDSEFYNTTYAPPGTTLPNGNGTAIYAGNTTGEWAVHNTSITKSANHGINATGADPQGDATMNWWGQPEGPTADQCVGNVNCGDYLSSPPDVDLPPVVGDSVPTDPDNDGKFEDINGDGEATVTDVVALFKNRASPAIQNHVDAYDFNNDGEVNVVDVVKLFKLL